jgi:hypothetical protein
VGRRRRGRGAGSEDTVARAIESFNGSEASRLVAGLMRTLGEPQASIGAAAGSPAEVRVTVAWELTWYQWAVAADGERPSVSALGKGAELDQLDGAARVWNAGVAEGGRLYVGRPPRPAARRRRLW